MISRSKRNYLRPITILCLICLSLSWPVMAVAANQKAATPLTVTGPPPPPPRQTVEKPPTPPAPEKVESTPAPPTSQAPPASSSSPAPEAQPASPTPSVPSPPPAPAAQPAPPAPPVPAIPPAPTKTATDFFKSGSTHLGQGQLDQAIADLTDAIQLKPNFWAAYLNRGTALRKKGELDQAIADYDQAIQMKPDHYDAYTLRGICYGEKGQYQEAIADYTRALEKKPHYLTYNGLAWIFATSEDKKYRNGPRAVELAQKAVQFHRNANSLDTLAAAYAETGKFKEAVETEEIAIDLLKKKGSVSKEELAGYEERLQAYKSNKPWRE